jgi:hypothetical protein
MSDLSLIATHLAVLALVIAGATMPFPVLRRTVAVRALLVAVVLAAAAGLAPALVR